MRESWSIIILFIMFYVAFYLNAVLPDQEMIVHWDKDGYPDGYGSKFMGLFFVPIMSLIIYLFFSMIPKVAVHKKNIEHFKTHFIGFKLAFVLFMAFVYILMIIQNMGYAVDFIFLLVFAWGAFMFYIGYVLQFTELNYFIGIRTPWTIVSPSVWKKTNKLGSIIIRCIAFFIFFSVFFRDILLVMVIVPLLTAVAYLFFYSYKEYEKERKKGTLKIDDLKKYTYLSIKKD